MRFRKFLSTVILTSSLLISSSTIAADNTDDKYQWTTIKGSISEIAEITHQNTLNEIPYPLGLTFLQIN